MRPVTGRSSVCETHPDGDRQFRATADHGHVGRQIASSYTADRAGAYISSERIARLLPGRPGHVVPTGHALFAPAD